jgi:hypothetical protein
MGSDRISIATITLARSEEEEALLRKSLVELAKLKLPVFITDGGSRPGFIDFLQSVPNFILSNGNTKGVWQQAKTSLLEAYKRKTAFVFYTEPDKSEFFRYFLKKMLAQLETNDKSGIVLASRSTVGLSTFPAFQRMTETTINNCCSEVIGNNFDYTYGPFLLNSQLIPYLELVQEDVGWGWRPYVFGIAKRLNLKLQSYVKEFSCPLHQQDDSPGERLYRIKQLNQNIQGLLLSQSVEI